MPTVEGSAVLTLTEWAVVHDAPASAYLAPEQGRVCLSGKCDERARALSLPLGERLTTSAVEAFDPTTKVARTFSGSEYRLDGPPSEAYAKWCEANGYDPVASLARA